MFNKIQLTVFTLLVFVCCVAIFPIHCDLRDFLCGNSGLKVSMYVNEQSAKKFRNLTTDLTQTLGAQSI